MLKNQDLARFVASLLPTAVKKGLTHHVLLAFNAATVHDFIKRSKTINEGTVAYLLPALLEPLHQKPKKLSKDAVVSLDIGFFFQAHSYHYFSSSEVIFLPRFRESVISRINCTEFVFPLTATFPVDYADLANRTYAAQGGVQKPFKKATPRKNNPMQLQSTRLQILQHQIRWTMQRRLLCLSKLR
jgi:hypothetical protein